MEMPVSDIKPIAYFEAWGRAGVGEPAILVNVTQHPSLGDAEFVITSDVQSIVEDDKGYSEIVTCNTVYRRKD